MTRPEDISERAWEAAMAITLPYGHEAVARAIAAEGVANRRLQVILETHRVVTLADDCGARWVRTTIANHVTDFIPELGG